MRLAIFEDVKLVYTSDTNVELELQDKVEINRKYLAVPPDACSLFLTPHNEVMLRVSQEGLNIYELSYTFEGACAIINEAHDEPTVSEEEKTAEPATFPLEGVFPPQVRDNILRDISEAVFRALNARTVRPK